MKHSAKLNSLVTSLSPLCFQNVVTFYDGETVLATNPPPLTDLMLLSIVAVTTENMLLILVLKTTHNMAEKTNYLF